MQGSSSLASPDLWDNPQQMFFINCSNFFISWKLPVLFFNPLMKCVSNVSHRMFCQMLGYEEKNTTIRFSWQLFDRSGFTGLKVYAQLMSKTLDALLHGFTCLFPLSALGCCVLCCVLLGFFSCMSCSSPHITTPPRLGTFTVSLLDWSYFFVSVSWLCYLFVSAFLPSFSFRQQW